MSTDRYHVTMASFGDNLPENWEAAATYMNELIDDFTGTDAERFEYSCDVWDDYCREKYDDEIGKWFAVQTDVEDDWSTGSRVLSIAKRMARELRDNGYPDALIAVIDDSNTNHVCIGEIRDF